MHHGFALVETALGRCSLAWSPAGIVAVGLPEASDAKTRARILDRLPDAVEATPPPAPAAAAQGIVDLLRGQGGDLSGIVLDMTRVPPFHRRVYEAARRIPPGRTLTYGQLAARCDAPGAARAVGGALQRNPFVLVVPCHRVVRAGGGMGGFSAHGGIETKERLLAIEAAAAHDAPQGLGA